MKNKKILAVVILCLALLAGGAFWFAKNRDNSVAVVPSAEEPKIDLSPATAEDQKNADQHKEGLVKQQEQTSQTPTTDQNVTPIIISSSYSNNRATVRSFVPGIFEDGGTCTLTLSRNGQTVTKQGPAVRNAQTTDCPPLSVERSEIPTAGSWKTSINYQSTTSSGSSADGTLEVQ